MLRIKHCGKVEMKNSLTPSMMYKNFSILNSGKTFLKFCFRNFFSFIFEIFLWKNFISDWIKNQKMMTEYLYRYLILKTHSLHVWVEQMVVTCDIFLQDHQKEAILHLDDKMAVATTSMKYQQPRLDQMELLKKE